MCNILIWSILPSRNVPSMMTRESQWWASSKSESQWIWPTVASMIQVSSELRLNLDLYVTGVPNVLMNLDDHGWTRFITRSKYQEELFPAECVIFWPEVSSHPGNWQAVRSPKCLHAVSVVYTLRVRCSVCPHQHLSFNYLLTISFKLHLFLFVPVRIHTLISCTAMTVTSCTIFWAEWGLNVLGCGLLVLLPVMDMTVGLLKIFMFDSGACV